MQHWVLCVEVPCQQHSSIVDSMNAAMPAHTLLMQLLLRGTAICYMLLMGHKCAHMVLASGRVPRLWLWPQAVC